jgi:hypothetical protein
MQVAAEYERVVVFRLGRLLGGTKGPGIFFILPCLDNIIRVDLRTVSCDVPTQEVRTEYQSDSPRMEREGRHCIFNGGHSIPNSRYTGFTTLLSSTRKSNTIARHLDSHQRRRDDFRRRRGLLQYRKPHRQRVKH